MEMTSLGKLLAVAGLVIAGFGLVMMVGDRIPWIGRLPGDIVIKGRFGSFYFPLMTCLVLSVLVSLVLFLFRSR